LFLFALPLGKDLFIRGITEGLEEKHVIKFFKKEGIAVESVKFANGKP